MGPPTGLLIRGGEGTRHRLLCIAGCLTGSAGLRLACLASPCYSAAAAASLSGTAARRETS
jgi:hypothetical protein